VALSWQAVSAPTRCRHRVLRLVSLLLLVAAIGSFGLSMVRISFSPAFIAGLQQLPRPVTLPAACVNGGIAAYSGLSLAAGGAPTVNAGCLRQIQDPGQANLGIQPLALLAALAILGAAAVTAWGPPGHRRATGVLSVVSAALLVVNTLRLVDVFAGHFGQGTAAITSGPDLGLWVVGGLLLLAVLAQVGSAGLGWARQALAPLEDGAPAPHP
jgi:hypothetical protein